MHATFFEINHYQGVSQISGGGREVARLFKSSSSICTYIRNWKDFI
jgi:hypothetical protein